MTRIIASGVPVKYPDFGDIRVIVNGDEREIKSVSLQTKKGDKWIDDLSFEPWFTTDLEKGPSYPLCAEPDTMLCAYFVLLEWFGESTKPGDHVVIEGEIEQMEWEPGAIY